MSGETEFWTKKSFSRLNKVQLVEATNWLCTRDKDLSLIVKQFGIPPLWQRPEGFCTLIFLILEQQVSLASARATFRRLVKYLKKRVTPDQFLKLQITELRELGFSRQKVRYTRLLAESIKDASLPLKELGHFNDDDAKAMLMKVTGIGHWTADVYLMEALGRPDVWPAGDLALALAVEKVKGLSIRPDFKILMQFGKEWRPFRAVAARIFWNYYLNVIKKPSGGKNG